MYEALFWGGRCIGVNEESKFYRGVVAFMIIGLKGTVPIAQEFAICISRLTEAGFKVRGIVTDNNHSININTFKILLSENDGDKQHFLVAPGTETIFFLFFDYVHLVK